ncbi:DivIVA domain-containing protein [Arthrobacter sp. YAF34]|uniref:DivIVA domain-containing protein n=1 Tax=Arthrobacter sp. YAF34 TaxID=3233083 RepID=UPI003F8ECD90
MSLFLVFLAIVLIGVAVLLGTGLVPKIFRRGRNGGAGVPLADGFGEPVASLPPVLLPERAAAADIDRLRFAVGLRGYRMDQVDQVLDDLRDQIVAKDQKIEALGEELERLRPPTEQRP